jgi:CarboxypepD_reg-like domain
MSHITDGDLHAYLDQALDAYEPSESERIRAHLESCAACAQRLDAARALRERAAGILGGAEPGAVPLASLEELKARAVATGGPTDGTSRSRFSWRSPYAIGLGWAATIALALWTGYSVKDFALNPSGRPPAVLAPVRELDAVSAVEQPAELDEKADQLPASKLESEALGLLSSGGSERGGSKEAGTPAAADRVSPDVSAALRADQPERKTQRRNRDEFRPAERGAAEPARRVARPSAPVAFDDAPANEEHRIVGTVVHAETGLPLAGAQVVVEGMAIGTLTDEEGRFAIPNAPAGDQSVRVVMLGFAQANDTVTIGPNEPADITFELSPSLVALDAMVVTANRAAALGEPLVPDLEVRRNDRVELPGMGQGMLIVQILPSGGDLELWRLTASELAVASPGTDVEDRAAEITAYFKNSLPPGWSMAVLERRDGYLVARAPLPQEELDALVERVPDGG